MPLQTYKQVVDIGSRYLKAVVAKQTAKGKFQVQRHVLVDSAPDVVFRTNPSEEIEIPQSFGPVFNQLVRSAGLKKSNVMLMYPDFPFLVNMMTVPAKATAEEKKNAIDQDIATFVPAGQDKRDWIIETKEVGQLHNNILILIAMIRRDHVLDLGGWVQKTGVNPIAIDTSILNAINVFHDYMTDAENLEKNIALMNFGHFSSSVVIFKQGKLTTFHNRGIGTGTDQTLIVGGWAFTRRIMEHFKLSEEDAEEYKKNEVFFLPEFVPEQDKIANYQVIKPIFGELVKGLFAITEHYVARFREFKVDEIILTGGGANFSNIDVVLGGHLNTFVRSGADLVSIVDANGAELPGELKNLLIPAIGGFARE